MFRGSSRDPSLQAVTRQAQRSATSGRGCLVLFALVFIGAGSACVFFLTIRPAWKSLTSGDWRGVPCVVVSSEVETNDGEDGPTYSVKIVYDYRFAGRPYQSDRYGFTKIASSGYDRKKAIVDRYPPGSEHTCYVNPRNPSDAVLVRRLTADMLVGLFGVVFISAGGAMVWFAFRAIGGQRDGSGHLARLRGVPEASPPWSRDRGVSSDAQVGPVTLKTGKSRWATLVTAGFFAMFWNGIVSVFVAIAVAGFRRGDPEWLLTVFLTPFVLVGLALLVFVLHSLLSMFNPRPTLTLDKRDIALGDSLSVSWRFSGQTGSLQRLAILLEGKEQAEYRRGTSTYTDKETFAQIRIVDTINPLEVPAGETTIMIPADSMHSFHSNHNQIVWSISVVGEIRFWPDVNDSFAIDVGPLRRTQGARPWQA
jgi:hypothetical protein